MTKQVAGPEEPVVYPAPVPARASGSTGTEDRPERGQHPPGAADGPPGRRPDGPLSGPWRLLPGLGVAGLIGGVATVAGRLVPVLGAPVFAVLLGAVVRALLDRTGGAGSRAGCAPGRTGGADPYRVDARRTDPDGLRAGAGFAGRYLLQAAVVLLGTGLSVRTVLRVGAASLPVMLGTLALCLVAAVLLGRLLRVPDPLRTLVGAGTGICGASAIAALSPVVLAGEAAVAYALSTIVVYNIVAVVALPPLGHLLGLSQHAFGLWAGTAVNDTSSVVAAGYAYGAEAGRYAVTVKLTRALMIIPVVLGVAGLRYRRSATPANRPALWRLVPPFLPLFLLAAAAGSAGLVPPSWGAGLALLAGYLVATALAGIGLGVRPRELRRAGLRPLALGGLLSVLVATGSLALQALLTP
ncbi:putative sulfate exporter family transporter [Micromonospora sp. NPDC049559]|uniref:YeiH family protein n=1 Tax=Micromonospora sp. NPDC049559 TaxID=3155923 RepID=UPI0034378706